MLYKVILLISLLASSYASSQKAFNSTNLIAYYPFDDNTMDYSGKNNHAYPIGIIEFKQDRLGLNKKSIELKGISSHLNVPNSRSLSEIKDEFTFSSWVFINEWDGGWSSLISKSSSENKKALYQINLGEENGGAIDFTIFGKSQIVKNVGFKKQEWFHISIIVKEGSVKFYINGILKSQANVKKSKFDKNEPLEIGKGRKGFLKYLNGRLDELYIFSRAVDESEIKDLMNNLEYKVLELPDSFRPMDEKFMTLNTNKDTPATIISGTISFANKTDNVNAAPALGPPDDKDEISDITRSYSLGCLGEVILEFTDYPLIDVPGPDLFVFECGPVKEPSKLSISKDGINWIEYGEIKGGTTMIDLVDFIKEDEKFYFVKFKDLGFQCEGRRAGADIDAVGVVVPKGFEKTNLSNKTFKISGTNNQVLKEEKTIPPSISDKKEIILVNEKEIKIFNKKVKIKVWDHLKEDGDLINLYLNDTLLFSNLKVTKKGEVFDIELQSGENIIQVEAINEGTQSPNTSAIRVFVDNQELEIIFSARKGERDALKIILE